MYGSPSHPIGVLVAVFALYALPWAATTYAMFWLLSLPLRRAQRAMMLLDLIEGSSSPEHAIVAASNTRDRTLGVHFHLLAAHIENGQRLSEALRQTRGFVPEHVVAMLAVGERLGNTGNVVPACRRLLSDGVSRVTGAHNFFPLILYGFTPVGLAVLPFLMVVIFPKFREITVDLTTGGLPPLMRWLSSHHNLITCVQIAMWLLVLAAVMIYAAGPGWKLKAVGGWLAWQLPWKRKRLQRDFSAMLALLLDAGVPEAEVVTLAAMSTANGIFIRRAETVRLALREGVSLTQAVAALDDTGEFRWRLTNAVHAHGGFVRALAGWHDALDAKAYQQEQAASQMFTTALVVANGVVIGLIAAAMFQTLTSIVQEMVLW